MCDPVTLGYVAIGSALAGSAASGASTYAQYAQQEANAKALGKFQQGKFASQKAAIEQGVELNQQRIRARQIQGRRVALTQIDQVTERAARAAGLARLSIGESGFGGDAARQLLAEFQRQEADAIERIETQAEFEDTAAELALRGTQLQASANLASIYPQPLPELSQVALYLNLAGTALGGVSGAIGSGFESGLIAPPA